ncbi:MAG: class I SAM-dependent methyltransferase [Planctomycetota bacterium]
MLNGELDQLVMAARQIDPTRPAELQSLRRGFSTDEVNLVLSLLEARKRASGRLENHDQLWLTVDAVQQSTRSSVARHKAQRFRTIVGDAPIIDLCCGIGSDGLALARGGPVILVDQDPLRLNLAQANVEMEDHTAWALNANAAALPLGPLPLHVDPDRRDGSRRRHRYAEMLPGPDILESLLERHSEVALKCGPGVDTENLPAGEVEFIQDGNDLVEATLWRGKLDGSVSRRATLLPTGDTLCGDPLPLESHPDEQPLWIHEPVPAIERAGLVSQLIERYQLGELHPGLGWLAGDSPIDSPWLRSYQVVERIPWREEKVRRWLRSRGEGLATVKTRGVSENPGALLKRMRGDGGQLILAILRHGKKQVAWILTKHETKKTTL